MEQYGMVVENKDESALVSLQRHLVCEHCGKCGLLSGASKREITIEALNPMKAKVGERVMMESDDSQVLFITFMLYLVPLVGLVGGILFWLNYGPAFGLAANRELWAALTGLFFMALIFLVIRVWDRRVKDDPRYKPVITEIVTEENPCGDPLY